MKLQNNYCSTARDMLYNFKIRNPHVLFHGNLTQKDNITILWRQHHPKPWSPRHATNLRAPHRSRPANAVLQPGSPLTTDLSRGQWHRISPAGVSTAPQPFSSLSKLLYVFAKFCPKTEGWAGCIVLSYLIFYFISRWLMGVGVLMVRKGPAFDPGWTPDSALRCHPQRRRGVPGAEPLSVSCNSLFDVFDRTMFRFPIIGERLSPPIRYNQFPLCLSVESFL